MKSFSNYCERFFKNRFFKFILFFIIFCVISLCKSCNVNAYTNMRYIKSDSYIKYHIGVFDEVGLNTLYTKNVNEYILHFNGNDNISFDIGTYGQYIRDLEIYYKYDTNYTVDTSKRYFTFNFKNFLGHTNSNVNDNNFLTPLVSATSAQKLTTYTNFYNFVPFYVEYYDVTNDIWVGVKVYYYSFYSNKSLGSNSMYILDIPVGTVFNQIRFRFGSLKNFITSDVVLASHIYGNESFNEDNDVWFYPYDINLSGVPYNSINNSDFKYFTYFGFGTPTINNLVYIPSSNETNGSDFALNTYNNNLPNSSYLRYTLDYTNFDYTVYEQEISDENESAYQEILDEIEKQEEISNVNNSFNSSLGSFTTSNHSTAFTGLFSSLFLYPLQKLDSIKDEDLWGTNQGGNQYLNLGLCTGHTLDGHFGNRVRVHITDSNYFEFPCPHYDIYPNLETEHYSFLPHGVKTNFYSIYKIILDGLLVYWMFVTVLNIYKYILDIKDTSVEVLKL